MHCMDAMEILILLWHDTGKCRMVHKNKWGKSGRVYTENKLVDTVLKAAGSFQALKHVAVRCWKSKPLITTEAGDAVQMQEVLKACMLCWRVWTLRGRLQGSLVESCQRSPRHLMGRSHMKCSCVSSAPILNWLDLCARGQMDLFGSCTVSRCLSCAITTVLVKWHVKEKRNLRYACNIGKTPKVVLVWILTIINTEFSQNLKAFLVFLWFINPWELVPNYIKYFSMNSVHIFN